MTRTQFIYKEILCDTTLRGTARLLACKAGVRRELKGFRLLVDAVILCGTGVISSLSDIYRVISDYHDMNFKSVMREINYTLMTSAAVPQNMSALVGEDVKQKDVHPGLIIQCLAAIFRAPDSGLFD